LAIAGQCRRDWKSVLHERTAVLFGSSVLAAIAEPVEKRRHITEFLSLDHFARLILFRATRISLSLFGFSTNTRSPGHDKDAGEQRVHNEIRNHRLISSCLNSTLSCVSNAKHAPTSHEPRKLAKSLKQRGFRQAGLALLACLSAQFLRSRGLP
jgi:hypothetical protein